MTTICQHVNQMTAGAQLTGNATHIAAALPGVPSDSGDTTMMTQATQTRVLSIIMHRFMAPMGERPGTITVHLDVLEMLINAAFDSNIANSIDATALISDDSGLDDKNQSLQIESVGNQLISDLIESDIGATAALRQQTEAARVSAAVSTIWIDVDVILILKVTVMINSRHIRIDVHHHVTASGLRYVRTAMMEKRTLRHISLSSEHVLAITDGAQGTRRPF